MDVLEKYFDHYVINARLKPAFFVVMPLAITTIAWCPEAQRIGGVIIAFMITFGVMAFLSNLVSNSGNELQLRLFKLWGGAPSTMILRHADTTLDSHTKKRYHRWLEARVPDLELPDASMELNTVDDADEVYISATNFLREFSRDKTKYPMVYSDNVAYGFSRNLLVMRWLGFGISFISVMLNLGFLYFGYFGQSYPNYIQANTAEFLFGLGAMCTSILLVVLFAFFVNKSYVHGRAIRYAKSLVAVCDRE